MSKDRKIQVEPKILLDAEIKKEINRHYSAKLGDDILGLECFSDPKLESHVCNVYARLDGDKTCMRCGHKAGRPCEVTCDVHHFCLAVYALRLGIKSKGRTRSKRIKDNLGKPFGDLYKQVMKRHELRKAAPSEPPEKEEKEESNTDSSMESADELVTTAQAAKMCGFGHAKMMGLVKSGKLKKVTKGKATYLKKKDVEEFKASLGGA